MKTIDLDSWDKFEDSLSSVFDEWDKRKKEVKHPIDAPSTPLFRGQSDSSWKLQTTLERFTSRTFNESGYYGVIRRVNPAIVSITQKKWDLQQFKAGFAGIALTGYEFMVYLRHHGFPSPLLDWTRSPYVAAFFAFRSLQLPESKRVAIYSFVDSLEAGRGYCEESPNVHGLGPYVETHKRHYAQQCEYTVCVKAVNAKRVYCSHESAFVGNASSRRTLKKYTLPISERRKVMKKLQRMNVTAFSLFGSEESLMETLAYQEIGDK